MVAPALTPPRGRVRGERLEARVTADQKNLIERAAALQGRSVTDFVLSSVQEAARRHLHHRTVPVLARRLLRVAAGQPQGYLVAPAQQFARRGQAGKYMPAGSAAGHRHFHASIPSLDNKWIFHARPDENPPSRPPAATTRWQGTNNGRGLAPQAPPVARTAFGRPAWRASSA